MTSTVPAGGNPQRSANHLLQALPPEAFERVAPSLALIPLTLRAILHQPRSPVGDVYFPGGGFCSIVTVLRDGNMVEVATIGREGAVDVSGATSGEPSPSMTI